MDERVKGTLFEASRQMFYIPTVSVQFSQPSIVHQNVLVVVAPS